MFSFFCSATEKFVSLQTSLQRLSSIEFAGRKPGTIGHQQAQNYINDLFHFNKRPLDKVFMHKFTYQKQLSTKQGTNFIYHKVGTIYPEQFIIITAHYDHLGKRGNKTYYGADDNASGTAILIALQQFFKSTTTKYSYLFVATDAEEDDLAGSLSLLKSQFMMGKQLLLNINLDMIAYGYRRRYLYLNKTSSNFNLNKILDKYGSANDNLALKPKRFLGYKRSSITRSRIDLTKASDHYEFSKRGIPYLFITGENHKYYHSTKDNYENIDIKFFNKVFASMKSLVTLVDNDF